MDKERTKADEYIIILFGLRWRSVQCNEPDRNSPPANNNKEKTEKGRGTPVPTPRPSRRNCMQRQSIFGIKFGHV